MSGQRLLPIPHGSSFGVDNLPFGIGRQGTNLPHAWVALGDHALDLPSLAKDGVFDSELVERSVLVEAFAESTLNSFIALGPPIWAHVRNTLQTCIRTDESGVKLDQHAIQIAKLEMQVPVAIGDYVDFYSSIHHATNLGRLFRPDGEALLPNWRHIPVGYHGRSGTIVADGSEIHRPSGVRLEDGQPVFGPTRSLDIELEVGAIVGREITANMGVTATNAEEYLFGICLVNDWSARDIQAFEYQPLGPFLGKSFATSMSCWVVTFDALKPFRVDSPIQEPEPVHYLRDSRRGGLDLWLEILIESRTMRDGRIEPLIISQTTFGDMYWTFAQQLAHVVANGATARVGDLIASGTVSGPTPGSEGSFIELTWRGSRPLQLPDGTTRSFLEDGDRVILRGWAGSDPQTRIGLGTVSGMIMGEGKS
ncbi:MAG: fumarylacetoacetase [Ilumatobacteraceae bacterium]